MLNRLNHFLAVAGNKLKSTGFFHVFGSSVINKVVSFAGGIILVRIISKADYGVYTFANSIYGFFYILTGLGMSSAVLQLCSESGDARRRMDVYSYGGRFGFKVNVILSLAILATAAFIKLPIEGANAMLAAFSFLPIFSFEMDIRSTWLRVELKNREYSYANSFSALMTVFFSVAFSLFLGAYGLIVSAYLSAIVTIIFVSWQLKVPRSIPNYSVDRESKRAMLGLGTISMLNNGLSSLMYLLDIFVIGLFIPDETVIASYKVATTIPSALQFIPAAIVTYSYPYFARHKNDKTWTVGKYKLLTFCSGVLNFSIAAVLILLSGALVPLVFGEQYTDAVPCFVILCLSFAFSGTFRVIAGNLLATQRRVKYNLFVAVFSSAFNTAANVILVLRWGSIGASVATLLTAILTSIFNTVYLIYVYKKLPNRPAEVN